LTETYFLDMIKVRANEVKAMASPMEMRTDALGATVVKNLKNRGFDAYYCKDKAAALAKALELIPKTDTVAWGGSMSISEIGLLDKVRKEYKTIDREKAKDAAERVEIMRRALLSDTFLMSANGISEDGQLVNIDGNGNRCAAMIYGPKQVIVIAGVNKIAANLKAAITRARTVAAPINVKRFPDKKTPCSVTGCCADCLGPESICNYFVVTRRCNPQGKIKVILVGEALGY
jgi:L-lactate utilization protein LutB